MVRNILDRKNTEISDIKLFYQKKLADLDSLLQSRDVAVASLTEKLNSLEKKHAEEVSRHFVELAMFLGVCLVTCGVVGGFVMYGSDNVLFTIVALG